MIDDIELCGRHRANLANLAKYLWNLPQTKFHMRDYYLTARDHEQLPRSLYMVPPAQAHANGLPEGATACASAHLLWAPGVHAPDHLADHIPPIHESPNWFSLVNWYTGLNDARSVGLHRASTWLFASWWWEIDNTPRGAAQRVEWLLRYGVPEDARKQALGAAPLCYQEIEL